MAHLGALAAYAFEHKRHQAQIFQSGRSPQGNVGFPSVLLPHLRNMQPVAAFPQLEFRTPAEPMPPPIKEPTEPPENPDVPLREPDPEEPAQI